MEDLIETLEHFGGVGGIITTPIIQIWKLRLRED